MGKITSIFICCEDLIDFPRQVAQFGILEHLVRISLGAEPKEEMARKVELALQAIQVPN